MYYTIYKITNILTNKIYIGKHQTNNLDDEYMGSGKYLKCAIKKYGIEHFSKEILHIFDNEEEMNAKEAELVTKDFVLEDTNYNICVGGQGGWSYVNSILSDEYRKYLGTIGGFSNRNNLSADSIRRIEEGCKLGAKNSDGLRVFNALVKENVIKHPTKDKPLSESHKTKISNANKGQQVGEQNHRYGTTVSEKTKAKVRETWKHRPMVKCKFCDFTSNNPGHLTRWHNDNCKYK